MSYLSQNQTEDVLNLHCCAACQLGHAKTPASCIFKFITMHGILISCWGQLMPSVVLYRWQYTFEMLVWACCSWLDLMAARSSLAARRHGVSTMAVPCWMACGQATPLPHKTLAPLCTACRSFSSLSAYLLHATLSYVQYILVDWQMSSVISWFPCVMQTAISEPRCQNQVSEQELLTK